MNVLPLKDYLTDEEIKSFHEKNNWLATWELIQNWAWIALAFTLVYFYPAVWAIVPALFIIGGKQLGCAIIMHDAGHHALFQSKGINIILGNIFGAWPIFHNVNQYAPYHLKHHLNAGLNEDPDLLLTRGYPTTRASLIRKFFRDLSGITGVKAFTGLMMMHLGYLKYNLGNRITKSRPENLPAAFIHNLSGPLLANLFLVVLFWLLNAPWLYLLWIGAYLTTFQFSLRVRSMAEHSMSPDPGNPKQNSRTVKANFIEKILFAPLHVNYHAEHHLAMAVPSYRLPALRNMMKSKNQINYGLYAEGYWAIIRRAASAV